MCNINDVVVEHLEIDIVNRKHDFGALGILSHLKGFCINNPVIDDVCKLSLQNILRGDLKIMINGEIHIIARDRSDIIAGLKLVAKIVDINGLRSLRSLQLCFQSGFDSGFSDNIAAGVGIVLLLKTGQFLRTDFSGITENLGKIFTVIVSAYRIIRNIHALQMVLVLQNGRHCFLGHILRNGGRDILLIAVQIDQIANRNKLQETLRIISLFRNKSAGFILRILALSNTETL